MRKVFFILLCLTLCSTASVSHVTAWGNGGYSESPSTPKYGTHDWIAEHALDWLPPEEKRFITDHLLDYRYGTELPDKTIHDGIGDTPKHIVYYSSTGTLMKNSSADRASDLYTLALNNLTSGDFATGAQNAGAMSHYIADLASFGHVMGVKYWGDERHHDLYEKYVGTRTSKYDSEFNSYLIFDGELTIISAYDAALKLAYDTTFDVDGDLTCVWMDQNYDYRSSNPEFNNRCGESLNLAVNIIADVLHTLWLEAGKPIPELNLNAITALVFILITATVIISRRSRRPPRLCE